MQNRHGRSSFLIGMFVREPHDPLFSGRRRSRAPTPSVPQNRGSYAFFRLLAKKVKWVPIL